MGFADWQSNDRDNQERTYVLIYQSIYKVSERFKLFHKSLCLMIENTLAEQLVFFFMWTFPFVLAIKLC